MEKNEPLLPHNISAKLDAFTADVRANTAALLALEVKLLAGRLFIYREQKTTYKLRKKARTIYHDLDRIRRRLVDDRKLDGQDVLEPARSCIEELIDLASDTMSPKYQP